MERHLHRCPKQAVATAHAAGEIADSEAFQFEEASKPAKLFVCKRDGCRKSYSSQMNLNAHVRNYHDWVKQKCDKVGCTDQTEFETGTQYAAHVRLHHDNTYESRTCDLPPCTERECRLGSRLGKATALVSPMSINFRLSRSRRPFPPSSRSLLSPKPAGQAGV